MAPKGLADFGLKSYVSQSGLSSVLKQIREHGLPSSDSRQSIKRAREEAVRVETTHGCIFNKATFPHVKPSAEPIVIEYIQPAALLSHMVSSTEFGEYMMKLLSDNAPSHETPWGIAVYADEVSPGNQLKHDNKRKVWALYWSLCQFGTNLCRESLWMTFTVVRSSHVVDMGGLGTLVKFMLKSFFSGVDFRQGVALSRNGTVKLLFASLDTLVADEAAIRAVWEVKGSSGSVPCFLCKNVVLHRSGLHSFDSTSTLVSSTCTDMSKIHLHTDASVFATIDMLQAKKGVLSPGDFARVEQSVGMRFRLDSILACHELRSIARPISVTQWDWMHVFVVKGIWNLEVGFLVSELNKNGVKPHDIHAFMQTLIWPASIGSKSASGANAFHKRSIDDESFKCSASEAVGIYAPLRSFLQARFRPTRGSHLDLVLQSYYSLAAVLDLLRSTVHGAVPPQRLHDAVVRHLNFFKLSYGEDKLLPKHHMSLHLASQLAKKGRLLTCWVHERKHKEVKRFANSMCNTSHMWESSVLESMIQAHMTMLSDPAELPSQEVQLDDPKPANQQLRMLIQSTMESQSDVFTSKAAFNVTAKKFVVNDCVIFESHDNRKLVGQIWFHAKIQDVCLTCVSEWQPLGQNRFNVTDNPILIPTAAVLDACIYYMEGAVAVLIPLTSY